jgi:hypothetical protein
MRKSQNLQTAPSNPCIKNSPISFKNPGLYIYIEAQMRNPNFPQDLASFWDQITLQMALKSSKNQFMGIILVKNHFCIVKTHFYLKIHRVSPLGYARAL